MNKIEKAHIEYNKLGGGSTYRDLGAWAYNYGDFLLEISADLLEALKECHARIFNDNAGLDELRDPEVTKVLNSLALQDAERAIRKVEE